MLLLTIGWHGGAEQTFSRKLVPRRECEFFCLRMALEDTEKKNFKSRCRTFRDIGEIRKIQ